MEAMFSCFNKKLGDLTSCTMKPGLAQRRADGSTCCIFEKNENIADESEEELDDMMPESPERFSNSDQDMRLVIDADGSSSEDEDMLLDEEIKFEKKYDTPLKENSVTPEGKNIIDNEIPKCTKGLDMPLLEPRMEPRIQIRLPESNHASSELELGKYFPQGKSKLSPALVRKLLTIKFEDDSTVLVKPTAVINHPKIGRQIFVPPADEKVMDWLLDENNMFTEGVDNCKEYIPDCESCQIGSFDPEELECERAFIYQHYFTK